MRTVTEWHVVSPAARVALDSLSHAVAYGIATVPAGTPWRIVRRTVSEEEHASYGMAGDAAPVPPFAVPPQFGAAETVSHHRVPVTTPGGAMG